MLVFVPPSHVCIYIYIHTYIHTYIHVSTPPEIKMRLMYFSAVSASAVKTVVWEIKVSVVSTAVGSLVDRC